MTTQYIEHPQTKEKIPFEWNKSTPPTSDDIDALFTSVSSGENKTTGIQFLTGPVDFVKQSATDVSNRIGKATDFGAKKQNQPLGSVQSMLYGAGQIAGAVGDIGINAISSATPPTVKEMAVKSWNAVKSLTVPTIQKLSEGNPEVALAISQAKKGGVSFLEKNPGVLEAIETALNISGVLPSVKGLQIAGKGSAGILPAMKQPTQESLQNALKETVRENLTKGIKVSPNGKETWTAVEKYFENADSAIIDIVKNKDNLNLTNIVGDKVKSQLPVNRKQFAEAINSTKRKIFQEYIAMTTAAGKKGAMVDLRPIAKELDAIINSPVLNADATGKRVIAHAKRQQKYLNEVGQMNPLEAQDWIKNANDKLHNAYDKGSYLDMSISGTDMGIASMMRKNLDTIVTATEGAGYQDLKRRYGALASLEEGTTKAAFAGMGKKSAPNFFDITSGTALLHGLISMNPVVITTAGFMESLNMIRRKFKDPDRYIKKMFMEADKAVNTNAWKGMSKSPTEIKKEGLGKVKLSPDDPSGVRPTPKGLPMPERGFTLNGNPYGETLRPVRRKSDVIDAEYTSNFRELIEQPRRDQILQLPYQGFNIVGDVSPLISRSKLSNKAGDRVGLGTLDMLSLPERNKLYRMLQGD
jgi:hypothetical protein